MNERKSFETVLYFELLIIALVRLSIRKFEKQYEKSENDIKALQSVGQIIGEVMKQLDEDRCKHPSVQTYFSYRKEQQWSSVHCRLS